MTSYTDWYTVTTVHNKLILLRKFHGSISSMLKTVMPGIYLLLLGFPILPRLPFVSFFVLSLRFPCLEFEWVTYHHLQVPSG